MESSELLESELEEKQSGPVSKKMRPDEVEEYDRLVDQLAQLLKIARHPDSSITIKAARLLIENRQTFGGGESLEKLNEHESGGEGDREIRIQGKRFNIDDVPLPPKVLSSFEGGDVGLSSCGRKDELIEIFERASRALKLLYLSDQKQLQFRINEIISTIQSLTANPKTATGNFRLS